MTINEDVPGIEVAVQIAGADVVEYDCTDADDDWKKVTKYIECTDSVEFAIRVSVNDSYDWGYKNHVLAARAYIDGKHIRGSIFRARSIPQYIFFGSEERNPSTGLWTQRNFKFSSITMIDDARKERVEQDRKLAQDLGVIEIRVTRGIEYGPVGSGGNSAANNGKLEISEKSLKGKAISHGTSYSAAHVISAPQYVDFRHLPEDEGPIAVFRFLYRSREALKNELIIPRTPTPRSPTFDALSAAERDRLARERHEELRSIKREGRRTAVKRELDDDVLDLTQNAVPRRPAKISRRRTGGREVIDLTEDD